MTESDQLRSAAPRWLGFAVGVPIMAWGVRGALLQSSRVHPTELARWIVGSALAHDGLVIPLVVTVATLGRRWVSPRAWPAMRWALAATGCIGLVAWPFVRGYGDDPGNPSLLPRPYVTGTLAGIGLVWITAGALVWRSRRRLPPPSPAGSGQDGL